MKQVQVPAFAKVNLRLEILGRRADGYHELRTIFQSLTLHDSLHLSLARGREMSLRVEGNPGPGRRSSQRQPCLSRARSPCAMS